MKFGQLIEYNMRNIFFEKSFTKYGGQTIPSSFSKKSKLSVFLDQKSKVLYTQFLLFAKSSDIKIYSNEATDRLLLHQIKLFYKTKRGLELVSFPHFLPDLFKKIFIYYINCPNFIVWLSLLREMLDNMCIVIVC